MSAYRLFGSLIIRRFKATTSNSIQATTSGGWHSRLSPWRQHGRINGLKQKTHGSLKGPSERTTWETSLHFCMCLEALSLSFSCRLNKMFSIGTRDNTSARTVVCVSSTQATVMSYAPMEKHRETPHEHLGPLV